MGRRIPPLYQDAAAIERQASRASHALSVFRGKEGTRPPDSKIPGFSAFDILDLIPKLLKLLELGFKETDAAADLSLIEAAFGELHHLSDEAGKHLHRFMHHKEWLLDDTAEEVGTPFWKAFIEGSMGVDLDSHKSPSNPPDAMLSGQAGASDFTLDIDNSKAVRTIKRVLGFSMIFAYAGSAIGLIGKIPLAGRWAENALEPIAHISEELGVNFFLGTLLETIFEQSVGRPLEESINIRTHPNRLDMMTVRTLARQHKITPATFWRALDNMGYPDELKAVILKLDSQQLPVNEIQAARFNGVMDDQTFKEYLEGQGYTDQDIAILKSNYIEHAQTQAKTLYRTAARTAFLHGHISDGQFRGILADLNTPSEAIETEVKAVQLEQTSLDHSVSLSILKAWHQLNIEPDSVIDAELHSQGYSDTDIGGIKAVWDHQTAPKVKRLSSSRILTYLKSGVIQPFDAYNALLSQGYTPTDAHLMVDNVHAKGATHSFGKTPATIISALRHGVIGVDAAREQLADLHMDPSEIQQRLAIVAHSPRIRSNTIPGSLSLNSAQILAAMKQEVIEQVDAVDRLEALGYSLADATILVRTALKGELPGAGGSGSTGEGVGGTPGGGPPSGPVGPGQGSGGPGGPPGLGQGGGTPLPLPVAPIPQAP